MRVALETMMPCFQGIIPAIISTCSRGGEPNVTYLSQVHYLDAHHVALSCQFFNKTRRNVGENPYAALLVHQPVTMEAFRLRVRFDHAESSGPLFDQMALRIQAIASHSGMAGVFRLLSADVYEVLDCEQVEGFLLPPDPVLDAMPEAGVAAGPLTELRGLQVVSERIARAGDLESLLNGALRALEELLGFSHAMVLLQDEPDGRLYAVASRGYGSKGIGAEVAVGDGIIGTVARSRRVMRVAGVGGELRYGRAIRGRAAEAGLGAGLVPEIPLPGLPDAQAQLAIPLLAGERLVGVLAVESRHPLQFDEWDETFLGIVGNQIALGVDRFQVDDEPEPAPVLPLHPRRARSLVYYRNDDCVFADGEYLPGGDRGRPAPSRRGDEHRVAAVLGPGVGRVAPAVPPELHEARLDPAPERELLPQAGPDREDPGVGVAGVDGGPPGQADPPALGRAVRPERILRGVGQRLRVDEAAGEVLVEAGVGEPGGRTAVVVRARAGAAGEPEGRRDRRHPSSAPLRAAHPVLRRGELAGARRAGGNVAQAPWRRS